MDLGRVEDAWTKRLPLRQVCENYLANVKDAFGAFMDLDKAYYTTDRHGMGQMLGVNEVGEKLLKAVQYFYVNSRACDRWEMMRVSGFWLMLDRDKDM